MLQQLFQQPAVEKTFVDLLCVVEDFLIPLEPGEISRNAAFVGVFAGLVVFRATVGYVWTGMTQGILEEITAELLSQHTAKNNSWHTGLFHPTRPPPPRQIAHCPHRYRGRYRGRWNR